MELKNYNLKTGDNVQVIRWGGLYSPEMGNEGTIVSMINDYPKIKFKNPEPMVEDINGYCTVDPIILKKIS